MNATLVFLVTATVLAPPATTSAERSTRIYVRTTPPGASIVLDGKELGTSDGLFLVPPGVRKITLEMDGYDPEVKTLDVKEGWITRVEVKMVRKGNETQAVDGMADRTETLRFVRWVIQDKDTMTFEGEPVTPDGLPLRLANVADRSDTVLEVGYSPEISVMLRDECIGKATVFAQQFGFKYASDIGVQELGSKGSSAQGVEAHVPVGENTEEDALSAETNESVSVPVGSRGLLSELRDIQVELVKARQKYAGQHPEIKRLEERLRDISRLIQLQQKLVDDGRSRRQRAFERIIYDLDERIGLQTIDLETGWSYDLPEGIWTWEPQRVRTWIEEHEVDLIANHEDNQWGLGLTARGGILVPAPDVSLDEAANRVSAVLEEKERLRGVTIRHEDPVTFWLLPEDSKPPLSFAFRTAEGTEGLLQIIEINSLSHRPSKPDGSPPVPRPKSMMLRWKVTKHAPPDAGREESISSSALREAKTLVATIAAAADRFHLDVGEYPGSTLELLLPFPKDPGKPQGWAGPYLKTSDGGVPVDPWGNPYQCIWGGDGPDRYLGIGSLGPDGKRATADDVLSFDPADFGLPLETPAEPATSSTGWQAPDATDGVLEFRIAANKEEAKSLDESGKDLGWYDASPSLDQQSYLVAREENGKTQVLLWKTPGKSMTAAKPGEKPWQIISVSVIAEPSKPGRIGVVFDVEGGRRLQELTSGNIDRRLAVVIDGRIIACPIVKSPIGQRVEITGNFSAEELTRLSSALQAGLRPERPALPNEQPAP